MSTCLKRQQQSSTGSRTKRTKLPGWNIAGGCASEPPCNPDLYPVWEGLLPDAVRRKNQTEKKQPCVLFYKMLCRLSQGETIMIMQSSGKNHELAREIYLHVGEKRFRCSDLEPILPALRSLLPRLYNSGIITRYRFVHRNRDNEYQLTKEAIERIKKYNPEMEVENNGSS
jgi:hypothetical protein